MNVYKGAVCLALSALMAAPPAAQAANHREAPITALDHKADITDIYAFASYTAGQAPGVQPHKITLILCVDPLLDPANGPNWFPFDPDILYEIKIDNNHDALADVTFQFRFNHVQLLQNLFQVYAGIEGGAVAPANSPAPVRPGTPLVPGRIKSFTDAGVGQRQNYTVTMVRGGESTRMTNNEGSPQFWVVPANVGPRTMDYEALFNAGTYRLSNGVSLFAGTVDDAFWINLGATFDTLNLPALGSGVPGVLTDDEDAANQNFASDTVSGYAVNAIAIEVPVEMITSTRSRPDRNNPAAAIGVWATTSRPQTTIRRSIAEGGGREIDGPFRQVQRMGNPLINEVLIGTGSKDRFSMDEPANDSQFAPFLLDPALARVLNALTQGVVSIPPPPRTDLLPLVTYAAPIAPPGTPAGPVADLLRLNVGIPATDPAKASRLGLLGGDAAGFPNGRRVFDDVTDIALRVVAGVLAEGFNKFPNNRLGDGVNVNDVPDRAVFPYLANCPSGPGRRHIDPGEPGGGPTQ